MIAAHLDGAVLRREPDGGRHAVAGVLFIE